MVNGRPRRVWHLLRQVFRRQYPGPGGAAAGAEHLHAQLHDASRPAEQSAERDADCGAVHDEFIPPVVYNWSLGVQREIGFQLVLDAAYVGNAARDQLINNGAIDGRPYGYAYQGSSLDPTVISGGQAQPLPDDLLRPYQGYGPITQRTFADYRDYHALQVLDETPPHR